jgi:hypothetical protein
VEPENQIVFLTLDIVKKYVHKSVYRTGVSSILFADENVAPSYFGYLMKPYLNDIITLKASQLQEAGILTYLLREFESVDLIPEPIGPQVLTLKHLEAGFVVIFSLLASSFAVFAIEIAPKLSRMFWAWLRKAIFSYVVVKFTKMNKLM